MVLIFLGMIMITEACSIEQHLVKSEKQVNKAIAKGYKPAKVIDTLYITKIDSFWNETTKEFTKYVNVVDTLYEERVVYKYMSKQERKHLKDSASAELKKLKEQNDFDLKMKGKENKSLKIELAKERQKSKQIKSTNNTKKKTAFPWEWLLSTIIVFILLVAFLIYKFKRTPK